MTVKLHCYYDGGFPEHFNVRYLISGSYVGLLEILRELFTFLNDLAMFSRLK